MPRVCVVCVWCQREGRSQPASEAEPIVGICDEHVTRFVSEVESVLDSGATAARDGRAGSRRAAPDVVDRVAAILTSVAGTDMCDRCVAADVHCSVDQAARAASTLAGSADFLRDEWRCGRCGTRAPVTRARPRRSGGRARPASVA